MGRTKNSLNKQSLEPVVASNLSIESRINFLANLIIDRITDDQNNSQIIYKKLTKKE